MLDKQRLLDDLRSGAKVLEHPSAAAPAVDRALFAGMARAWRIAADWIEDGAYDAPAAGVQPGYWSLTEAGWAWFEANR
jgi:hypothetical protein